MALYPETVSLRGCKVFRSLYDRTIELYLDTIPLIPGTERQPSGPRTIGSMRVSMDGFTYISNGFPGLSYLITAMTLRLIPTWGADIPTPFCSGDVTVAMSFADKVRKVEERMAESERSVLFDLRLFNSVESFTVKTCITESAFAIRVFSALVNEPWSRPLG